MWQSHVWNGQEAAFRTFAVVGIVLLILLQPDAEGNRDAFTSSHCSCRWRESSPRRTEAIAHFEGETLLARTIRMPLQPAQTRFMCDRCAFWQVSKAFEIPKASRCSITAGWRYRVLDSRRSSRSERRSTRFTGVLILACDQPRLSVAHLRNLIDAFSEQADPSIAASEYSGALGVPAAFPRRVFPYLFALQGDKGARTLLLRPPCR